MLPAAQEVPMRVVVAILALAISGSATAATPIGGPYAGPNANCPRTSSYLAEQSGVLRGKPPAPRKLNQLPMGTAYMAVMRHIGGCEAPLTMVEYRNSRRR
jgi:hypothetical protein